MNPTSGNDSTRRPSLQDSALAFVMQAVQDDGQLTWAVAQLRACKAAGVDLDAYWESNDLWLSPGADPQTSLFNQRKGRTAAQMVVIHGGDTRWLQALAEAGADVAKPDSHGTTTLALACMASSMQAAGTLLDLGADIDEKTNPMGATFGDKPYTALALMAAEDRVAPLLWLIERGANVAIEPRQGEEDSPLSNAIRSESTQAALKLIEAGAPRHNISLRGSNALWSATNNDMPEVVIALLEAGETPRVVRRKGEEYDLLAYCDEKGHAGVAAAVRAWQAARAARQALSEVSAETALRGCAP